MYAFPLIRTKEDAFIDYLYMWYPNITLSHRIRLGIMFTLIASFFIISPIIILYTAGYRFNFETRRIQETGVITIEAKPKNAEVFLQGIKQQKSIPIRLPNRAPGFYDLSIEQEGYLSWNKTIEVESKQTTYATDIHLFLDVAATFEYKIPKNLISSYYSTDGRFTAFLLMPNTEVYEIILYDFRHGKEYIIWRGESQDIPKIKWSTHAPLLAIIISKTEKFVIQTIDARNITNEYIYAIATTTIPLLQWQEHGNGILYAQEGENIISLSKGNRRLLGTVTSSIWFVDSDEDIWNISNNHELLKNDEIIIPFVKDKNILEILDTRSNHLIARGEKDIKILWLDTGETTTIQAYNVFPRTYGKNWSTWIAWSEWEVFEILESGDIMLLTRTNQQLQAVNASTKHKTLFFAFENKIIAFHPNHRTTHTLFEEGNNINSIVTDENGMYILFDSSINEKKGIYKRKL